MLSLREVDKENWIDVIRLSSGEDQQNRIFEQTIASNCLSIAQASLDDHWTIRAMYDADTLIGFTMYGFSEELDGYELCRFMIDYRYQGKGYGKAGLEMVVKEMKREFACDEILICFQPDNLKAKNLYEGFGFENTGKTVEGNVEELVYRYGFKRE